MTKKNTTILKTKKFFCEYPIILLLQHNNLSVKEWSRLRVNIKQLDSVNMLILKNSIVEHVVSIEKVIDRNIPHSMFQGPCLAIGCLEFSQFSKIIKMFKITSKFLVIGAIVNGKLLTHLDLNKLLTISNNIYNSLLNNFSQSNDLCNLLQNSLNFQILQQIPINLINCLSFIKKLKEDVLCFVYEYNKKRSQSNRRFPYGYLVTTSLQLLNMSWAPYYSFLIRFCFNRKIKKNKQKDFRYI